MAQNHTWLGRYLPDFSSRTNDPRVTVIDAGHNQPWMAGAKDLEGDPCIHDGIVDMGCYELVLELGGVWGVLGLFTIYDLRFTIWRRRKEP